MIDKQLTTQTTPQAPCSAARHALPFADRVCLTPTLFLTAFQVEAFCFDCERGVNLHRTKKNSSVENKGVNKNKPPRPVKAAIIPPALGPMMLPKSPAAL